MAAPIRRFLFNGYFQKISKRDHTSCCSLWHHHYQANQISTSWIIAASIRHYTQSSTKLNPVISSDHRLNSTQKFGEGFCQVTPSKREAYPLFRRFSSYDYEQKRSTGQSQRSNGIASLTLGIGGFALCSAALAFNFWQDDNKETIEKMIARAVIAERENRLGDAEKFYHKAAAMCKEENNSQALLYTYDKMADYNMRQGHLLKAETLFKETLRMLLSAGMPKEDPGVVEISLKLAKICERMGRNEDAEIGFRWCIETSEKLVKDTPNDSSEQSHAAIMNLKSLLGMCLDTFARFLGARNRLAEAEKYYKRALEICAEDLLVDGMPHPQTVVLLNDLGTICDMRGHYDEAVEHVLRASQLAEKLSPTVLPTILCNLASITMHKGKREESRAIYQRALQVAEKQGDKEAAIVIRANLQKVL